MAEMRDELQEVKDELQTWKNMVKWVASMLYIKDGVGGVDVTHVDIGHEMIAKIAALNFTVDTAEARINAIRDLLDNG